ncbi:uncharacterized protein SPSK_06819 [Sporothrix schenckii 1099-18]|uniref:Uncharacterized protein n=1 Tax=Sporothrix schenckii 1099-18 TaxID=1397361 RepID=A0A0F2MKG7_SPOSC|nr:uncharacterized protein SPSK_06819 [Sporothrix schenckii 1099-18]KJR89330.1 hypothetical protein SPSK_06819 [Sporothrix schenckii 1099-18]
MPPPAAKYERHVGGKRWRCDKARELALLYSKILASSDSLRWATGVSSAAAPKPKDGGIQKAVEPCDLRLRD